ncbi:MAG: nucleotide exchange factor GrpE [Acidobacteriota bacterium]|jgi:molecular chaperone GrpE
MEKRQKTSKSESDTPEFQVVDKRQFLDLNNMDKTTVEEKPRYPAFVEELMARTAETERKFEEKKKQIDEEIGRTKTRLESDFQRRLDLDKKKIVIPFLEVMDNLHRAIEAASQAGSAKHLLEGVRMTADLFRSKLQAIGVEPIQTLEQPFDPNSAQAIGRVQVTDKSLDGIVMEEVQTGYSMNGHLLRPAQVRVGHYE